MVYRFISLLKLFGGKMFSDALNSANIKGYRRVAKVGDVVGAQEQTVVLRVALRQTEGS